MKSIKLVLLVLVLGFGFSSDAQKIKLKKGDVTVDDKLWLKYDGCGGWDQMCSLSNLNGEEIIYMKQMPIEFSNDKYWVVKFLGTNQTIEFELAFDSLNSKLLKKFYDAQVVNDDGTLNKDKVTRMVEKYGKSEAKRS